MNLTLDSFIDELKQGANAKGGPKLGRVTYLKKWREFAQLTDKGETERVTNIHQVYFDSATQQVTIEYYVVDDNYPNVVLSFAEFSELLRDIPD